MRVLATLAAIVWIGLAPAHANPKYAGIVVDAKTGKTLYDNAADAYRYPASLTKMMTLYLVFEAIDSGRVSKSTRIPVSANAAAEPPSKLGVRAGGTVTVEQAILSLVTRSANDIATAIAEYLGGSEAAFARAMTQKARALGMARTTFKNAHGLPNSGQRTTARDMARLGIALREHFPHHYHYFSTRRFQYGNAVIGNHNRLLGAVRGVDGIKTGYIRASGYNLVTSVQTNGRSIVAVVMGGRSGASRNAQMEKLVARYLPKAARRGSGGLIARSAPSAVIAGITLPKIGPVPAFRDPTEVRVALAYAAPLETESSFPMPTNRPVVGRAALIETLIRQRDEASAIGSRPDDAPRPPAAIGTDVDAVTTGSTMAPGSGWVIQIAAVPTRNEAVQLLADAKASASRALAEAQPFTAEYQKSGQQLYRARFSGFSGKRSAWAACQALERNGYACWATEQ